MSDASMGGEAAHQYREEEGDTEDGRDQYNV